MNRKLPQTEMRSEGARHALAARAAGGSAVVLLGLALTALPLLGATTGQPPSEAGSSQGPVAGERARAEAAPPGEPTLKVSPLKALENFEPAANAEYQLGPGDEIALNFPGHPELDTKMVVGPDGRITLPLAGSIDVNNKTRTQAAQQIIQALSPYYTGLTATVSVLKYGSNRITVIGNVQHPGVFYFDDTPTLLDAISRGGLMASSGMGKDAGVSQIPERCAIYRGNDQVVWVDLRQMLEDGNAMADMRLKRNDIVFVPRQQEVFVSVLGAVNHPGAIPLTPESTLTSILAEAGGMAEGAGRNIEIIQPSTGKTRTIAYKKLLTVAGNNEITLHSGDVIVVPKSGMYKATYVLQRLSPLATIGTVAAIAATY